MNRQERLVKQERREVKRKVSIRLSELTDTCKSCTKVQKWRSSEELTVCGGCWVRKEMNELQQTWRDKATQKDLYKQHVIQQQKEKEKEEENKMAKETYAPEVKEQAIELFKQGKNTSQIARTVEVTYNTVWGWIDGYKKENQEEKAEKPNEYEQVKESVKRTIAALEQTVKEKDEALEKANGEIKSVHTHLKLTVEEMKMMDNKIQELKTENQGLKHQKDDVHIARLEHEKAHLQATIELMNEQHEKKIQQAIESKSEVMNLIIEQREEIETLKKMLKRYL